MKNLINNIFLFTLLFFIPLFAEGKSTEKRSFIQEIKDRITKEVEKEEEKKSDEKDSRIEIVKDKIVKEKEKIETKNEEKKKEKDNNKDNYDYVHDYKNKHGHDYDRKYYKKKHEYDHYSDNRLPYWVYDDIYFKTYYRHKPDVIIYDDYSYIDDPDLISTSLTNEYRQPRKIAFLASSIEAAYLGKDIDDTYGVTGKISANLYNLHFNCFYQNIFSSGESLTIYSINGGVSLATQNFIFTPFLGAFYIEPLEEARFSYGANLQIFLPHDNYNLDLYTLNSSYGSLNFHNFSASLNYSFYIFNVGLGFNYNNYAGISFSGPLARLSFHL